MFKKICLAAFVVIFGASLALFAQSGRRNGGPAARLRSDIQRAIQNGNPTQDEMATLQRSLATLQEAREARKEGQPVDRERVQGALADVEKVFQSNSFRPADRDAVERDLKEIKNRHEK